MGPVDRRFTTGRRRIVLLMALRERWSDGPAADSSAAVEPAEFVERLNDASRALQGLLIALARANGLGMLEFLVLARAAEDDGVISGEAGRSLGLTTSTMTGLSDRLERDGLVRRHPHPTDRRLVVLKATARGRRICKRTLGPIYAELTSEARALSVRERTAVAQFLDRLIPLVREHTAALQSSLHAPPPARASSSRRTRRDSRGVGPNTKK